MTDLLRARGLFPSVLVVGTYLNHSGPPTWLSIYGSNTMAKRKKSTDINVAFEMLRAAIWIVAGGVSGFRCRR